MKVILLIVKVLSYLRSVRIRTRVEISTYETSPKSIAQRALAVLQYGIIS